MTKSLPALEALEPVIGFRLVNSRFPPISLFDDVADESEFERLYQLQALTNPRIQTEIGNLSLIRRSEIPFGITGCSYATSPFTHVNPEGSRFSDGQFGMLYLADTINTAIAEVSYHQARYWSGVHGLDYDRLVFRGLKFKTGEMSGYDATALDLSDAIYHPLNYAPARAFGHSLYKAGADGLRYHSVRNSGLNSGFNSAQNSAQNSLRKPGAICWGLFTPRPIKSVAQTSHFEFIWNGQAISAIHRVSRV